MKLDKRELGLGRHMELFHNCLVLVSRYNFVLRNKNMIQWIIHNVWNVKEADVEFFGKEQFECGLMVKIRYRL